MSDDKGINATAGDTCPNCGYCPRCKRSSQPWYPYPWRSQPWYPYPWYPFVVWQQYDSNRITWGQCDALVTDSSVYPWLFATTVSAVPTNNNIASTTDAGDIA